VSKVKVSQRVFGSVRLRRTVSQTLDEKLAWIDAVCARVAAAHAEGVVHGALHRGRIRAVADGSADIDFSPPSLAVESPAPEQLMGRPPDTRSDVFSLACVAYQVLADRPPFEGATFHALSYRLIHEDPPDLRQLVAALPASLVAWLQRGLAKQPADRFQDGGSMWSALRELRAQRLHDAGPLTKAEPAPSSYEDLRRQVTELCRRGDAEAVAQIGILLRGPRGNDAALAVRGVAPDSAIPTLIEVLSDRSTPAGVRGNVATALGKCGPAAAAAVPALAVAMRSVSHHGLALDATYAVVSILGIEGLRRAARSGVPLARAEAIKALGVAREAARPAVPELLQIARDRQDLLRDIAWSSLRDIGGDEAVAAIVEGCTEPLVATVRRAASRSSDDVDTDIYVLNPSAEPLELKTTARFALTIDDETGAGVVHGPKAQSLVLSPASATRVGEVLGWELDSALFLQVSYRRVGAPAWSHRGVDLKSRGCPGQLPLVGAAGSLHQSYAVNENGTRD
jgi:hypothetical protein